MNNDISFPFRAVYGVCIYYLSTIIDNDEMFPSVANEINDETICYSWGFNLWLQMLKMLVMPANSWNSNIAFYFSCTKTKMV